jgi:predicted NBD/HSP70 family sugar kinase
VADNRRAVLEAVRDHGPIPIRDIQRLTALGHTTVAGIVADLRAQGALVDVEADRSRGRSGTGRPPNLISLNPGLARLVGIQFEHTHIRAALTDLSLEVVGESTRNMAVADDANEALAVAAEMVRALIGSSGVLQRQVIGAAVALAAPVDVTTGTVRQTAALRSWVGIQPAAVLGRSLRLPVTVGNDATLAGFGEAVVGAGRGSQHVVYVKLSATTGCGIIIGGRPYDGATGTAGELAHVAVDDRGALCFCGNRGCLWLLVGAEKILRDLEPSHRRELEEAAHLTKDQRLERVIEWALDGDAASQQKLREVAATVGLALVNVCNLINPETIVVGGVLSKAGDLLFQPLRERVHTYTKVISPSPVKIVRQTLGERAEVLGAAALVLRSTLPSFRNRLQELLDAADSGRN